MRDCKKYIGVLLMGMALFACSQEEKIDTDATTGFRITLTDDVQVEARKAPSELEKIAAEKFQLKIVNQATGNTLYDGAYKSGTIPASAATYTVTAMGGTNADLAYDTPYYEGKVADVVVENNQTKTVAVPCKVANALCTVIIKDEDKAKFDDLYSSYYVEVKVGNYSLQLPNGEQSAYYKAGTRPTFTFKGTIKEGGKNVEQVLTSEQFTDAVFAAGAHCKLTLGYQAAASGLLPAINKVEVERVTISHTLPLAWLPKPVVNGFNADKANTLTYVETEDALPAVLSFSGSSAIQDVEFTVDFTGENLSNLNGTYTLSDMKEEDKAKFAAAGVELPTLAASSKTGKFDFTAMTARLQTNAGEEVTNSIQLRVKANDKWSSETPAMYTIRTVRPEFSVAVQPGNVWTKEFTVDEITVTKGNAAKIKDDLVYQYSADNGTTWTTCNDSRRQGFTEVPTDKHYQVRALYRGAISSETVEAELENPTQLPNSDMEDWYIETKKKSGSWPFKDKTYYTFHPYAEGEASSSWWDTNNDKAQGGTYAMGIWYEGCFASCVSYTEDVHGGTKAALIYLSGCGDGYANTSGSYFGGAMVGSLFIGSYSSGIVQGHSFSSRPSSLSFWYKYKPYNEDAFKVVVSLKNGDEEIATGVYEPTQSSVEDNAYQRATVEFNYSTTNSKATTICVQFLASNKEELSGNDFAWGTTIDYPTIGDWTVHMGSVLKIDDLSLIYDK